MSDPLVPATVSVKLPVGVAAAVATFSVTLPEPVTEDDGVKKDVAFAGSPGAATFTVPENPFSAPMLTV